MDCWWLFNHGRCQRVGCSCTGSRQLEPNDSGSDNRQHSDPDTVRIFMASTPSTNKQIPDHSIMDAYNKQVYLGQQYGYAVSNTPASTSETPLLLLQNPAVSTSSFPSGYQALFLNLVKLACLTSGQSAILRIYQSPTVTTAGTVQTPVNKRPASPNTSIASLHLSPTVSANGTLIGILSALPGQPDLTEVLTVLDPAQSVLITVQTSSSSTAVAVQLGHYEL